MILRETAADALVPMYRLSEWLDQYGVVAGLTGRGEPAGRGFDLGLWSDAPVGEVMGRWRALRRAIPGFEAVALGNQVHGTVVETAGRGRGWIQIDGVDGWVTTEPGMLLTVTVADCIPVYLVVPAKGVALLHGGWRGLAGGILRVGVERLLEATGGSAADVVMHCGVGICGLCYEVGSEVMSGCGLAADGPGPWHLDLRDRFADAAARLGVRRITWSPWCSAHDRSSFYSHRASRGADGRMVAYLGRPRG